MSEEKKNGDELNDLLDSEYSPEMPLAIPSRPLT